MVVSIILMLHLIRLKFQVVGISYIIKYSEIISMVYIVVISESSKITCFKTLYAVHHIEWRTRFLRIKRCDILLLY